MFYLRELYFAWLRFFRRTVRKIKDRKRAVIIVSPNGGQFKTLQDAMDYCSMRDGKFTIEIKYGPPHTTENVEQWDIGTVEYTSFSSMCADMPHDLTKVST